MLNFIFMVIALEYTQLYEDFLPMLGAIEVDNWYDPDKGWRRSFNLGVRRTVAVGLSDGSLNGITDCIEDVLKEYFKEQLEPMPSNLFYSTVKAVLKNKGVKFKEQKWGTQNVMILSDEVPSML